MLESRQAAGEQTDPEQAGKSQLLLLASHFEPAFVYLICNQAALRAQTRAERDFILFYFILLQNRAD